MTPEQTEPRTKQGCDLVVGDRVRVHSAGGYRMYSAVIVGGGESGSDLSPFEFVIRKDDGTETDFEAEWYRLYIVENTEEEGT